MQRRYEAPRTCGNCRYFVAGERGFVWDDGIEGLEHGECRGVPPVMMTVDARVDEPRSLGRFGKAGWPVVFADHFCRIHEERQA